MLCVLCLNLIIECFIQTQTYISYEKFSWICHIKLWQNILFSYVFPWLVQNLFAYFRVIRIFWEDIMTHFNGISKSFGLHVVKGQSITDRRIGLITKFPSLFIMLSCILVRGFFFHNESHVLIRFGAGFVM